MSSVIIAGDTSGTITLAAPAASGSSVLTLPVATDTLVGKATTDTLTNKTLTAPVLSGTATGTYTLAGTPTITSPTITGASITVAASAAPAFSAYPSGSQSISSSTNTKLALQSELFDTNSNFDSTTNYRFTPTVAGYYQFNGSFFMPVASTARVGALIYKNGAETNSNYGTGNSISGGQCQQVSALMYANGSSDYFEFYVVQTGVGAASTNAGAALTYFQAAMVRSA